MRNGRRPYRSAVRDQRAAETREVVVEAAGRCFEELGWSGTTMSGVAEAAGVSVKTVHAVGSKAYLLVEAFRARYVGGGGWTSLDDEDDAQDLLSMRDPEDGVATMTAWIGNAHRESGRLWYVLRTTALTEPLVRVQQEDLLRYKRESYDVLARWLIDIGVVPAEEVPDELFGRFVGLLNLVMSAETYVQLVADSGFTHEQYLEWVRAAIPTIRPC